MRSLRPWGLLCFLILNIFHHEPLSAGLNFSSEKQQHDKCVCLTGAEPEWQTRFFRLGCRMWLDQRQCREREVLSSTKESQFQDSLMSLVKNEDLAVGYVGHWASTLQLLKWIKKTLADPVLKLSLDFYYDNTACNGGSNPLRLKRELDELFGASGVDFKIRVNQIESIGMWESLPFTPDNIWMEYSSESPEIQFPACSTYRGGMCQKSQVGRAAMCRDFGGRLTALACHKFQKRKKRVFKKSGPRIQKSTLLRWVEIDRSDLSLQERKADGFSWLDLQWKYKSLYPMKSQFGPFENRAELDHFLGAYF